MRLRYAQALALLPARRKEALPILMVLAQKKELRNADDYLLLAQLAHEAGKTAQRDSAIAQCQALATKKKARCSAFLTKKSP